MIRKLSILSVSLLVLMLAGCASMDFMADTEDSLMTGDYTAAAKEIGKSRRALITKGRTLFSIIWIMVSCATMQGYMRRATRLLTRLRIWPMNFMQKASPGR